MNPCRIAIAWLRLPRSRSSTTGRVLGLLGTGSKSLVLRDVFVPEHRSVMVSDHFAGTPPGALVHPNYPVLRAPRGFLVSYSLPPVAVALGRIALDIACTGLAKRVSRGVTKVAESEVVQMALGEAAAAIDVTTMLLHTGCESSTAAVSSGRRITEAEALRAAATWSTPSTRWVGRSTACAKWTVPVGSMPRRTRRHPPRRDDDPDPPRRKPPGRDGALRQNAAHAPRGVSPTRGLGVTANAALDHPRNDTLGGFPRVTDLQDVVVMLPKEHR